MSLCLSVASFHKVRIRFTKPAVTGSPPIVHRGQEFVVEGSADHGDNVYRQVDSIEVQLSARDPRGRDGEAHRDSDRAAFDRTSRKFVGRLRVKEDEDAAVLFVRLRVWDRIEREYGRGALAA